MSQIRRLAAILAADVAGYSRLMGADEEGTLERLKALRTEIIDPKIAEHHGRIVKTTGDGTLVEFASVVDAVRCAVAVQQAMAERNTSVAADSRIELRIGINLGDVIVEGDDLYGDGVNIAARIEAPADAGGVFVSNTVHDHVRDRLPFVFEDLGEQQVKNIARPVRVYRVCDAGAARSQSAPEPPALPLPDKPSIAVLPFANMGGDPEQEYFADGMVEEIITALSRIRWLFVTARNSSFTYKGRSVDVKEVGRELGVRYVLEGSVRKAGNRVRITVQLIEAETGAHVWAERYDRSLDDVFALQDEITLSTVGAIEPSLRAAEIGRVKRKRPESLDAYDLVLRALPHVYMSMPEEAQKAIPLLQRALAAEPDYGLAHALLAWCFEVVYRGGGFVDRAIGALAVRHAHAALAHSPDDATALGVSAFVIAIVERDPPAAIVAFEKAIALSPSCSTALMFGAAAMGCAGETERALTWGEQAIRLSPFDRLIFAAYVGISLARFLSGRYEEAAAAARRAIQSNPGFSVPHMMLAASLGGLGRITEARTAAARVLELQPTFSTGETCAGFSFPAGLAAPFTEACRAAGLPE
jgi:adenylate cyclase